MHQKLSAYLDLLDAAIKERGLALLDLGESEPTPFSDLLKQFFVTDSVFEKIREDIPPPLVQLRNLLLARQISPLEAMKRYTNDLVRPAQDKAREAALWHVAHTGPLRMSSFLHLLQWRKNLAYERDWRLLLAQSVDGDEPELSSCFRQAVRVSQSYGRLFLGLADEVQKRVAAEIQVSDAFSDAIIMDEPLPAQSKETRHEGFAAYNAPLEILQGLLKNLAAQMDDEGVAMKTLFMAGQVMDAEIESNFDKLSSLPLFRGLAPSVVREILRLSRLGIQDKGSVFLAQGEPVKRFFILLDGWVKIYKSASDGSEAILNMLGKNEYLLDADFLHPSVSPVSAKAISKARVLSIPASALREHMARHKELAATLLEAMTQRVQRLISHQEQLTLRNAAQRVGWFLLNLRQAQNPNALEITLPYDKALIAAYLGIKPETFSRVLHNFRTIGFNIDRHRIVLPNVHALCEFCDSEAATQCCRTNTDECPRPDFRRVGRG
ncbi:MAG: cyclic nucleotide-binding domain-containing protein [Alphaproteobacteria bacterium]|nr:cyclic nucleotide-binding domain-containing protein [Alphaproteobacteria bacterium]